MFGRIPRIVRAAVDDATRAASIHNSQPWLFVYRGEAIDLWLDIGRAPHVVDPSGRWALQSAGAALANLELALAHRLGVRVTVIDFPAGPATPSAPPKGLVPIENAQLPPVLQELTHVPVASVSWTGGPADPSAAEDARA